jgi:thiol-disulfide isomerase/thioredoxin
VQDEDGDMKRRTIIGLVIAGVLVVGVGAAVAVSAGGGDPMAATPTSSPAESESVAAEPEETGGVVENEASAAPSDTAAPEPAPEAESPGAYVEYSEAALQSAEGTRVLFFHAPWCPQCRALEEDIEASGVPDGVTILKVDYDSNQDLRQQYDVRLQTTVVALDDDEDATASFVPYDEPTLDSALTGLGLDG